MWISSPGGPTTTAVSGPRARVCAFGAQVFGGLFEVVVAVAVVSGLGDAGHLPVPVVVLVFSGFVGRVVGDAFVAGKGPSGGGKTLDTPGLMGEKAQGSVLSGACLIDHSNRYCSTATIMLRLMPPRRTKQLAAWFADDNLHNERRRA